MFTPLAQLVRQVFALPRAPNTPSPGAEKLARILKIPPGELPHLRLGHRYHYRPFAISKKDGRERHILAPSPALKELQRRLLRRYLTFIPVHPAATAFMPGASIVRNARRHAGCAIVATVDLVDFFPSTTADRVRAFFLRQGWRGQALSAWMRLCLYHNSLPQGAPTSPCLSNLVNVGLDTALDELARRCAATYTRYGDDLTFSWKTARPPSGFKAAVHRQLLQRGYRVQPRKGWQIKHAADRPQITGLVLGRRGRIEPPARVRKKVRWLRAVQSPPLSHLKRHDPALQAQLRGYEGFLHMLDP